MFIKIKFVVLLWILNLSIVICDPIYTIIAPSKLRPNSDYHLSIQLQNSTQSATFNVTISGPSKESGFNRVDTTVLVRPYESRIINLEIGEWSQGYYKLIVKGHTNEEPRYEFSNETTLEFDRKSYSIFVQTDKAVYKPGQTVRFRAIIVNPSLIPNLAGSLDVFIKDPKNNLIKQWKRIFTHRGVLSEELTLSEQPPLGEWSIEIDVAGQKATQTFSVAEYVLPTFSVDIFLPPYATYNKSDVIATVKATYTYGKPVKGDVTLTVQPRIRHSSISFRPLEQFQTKIKLENDGKVDIPVNIVRDLNLKTDFFQREIEFFALVEEILTGRKYNKSSVMKIYHKEVKIELIKTSKTFKPGLKYTFFLKIAYQDDTPVEDDGPPVELRYWFDIEDSSSHKIIQKVPHKGLVQIDLYPSKNTSNRYEIHLNAQYRGETYYLETINCAQSPSNNFIQVVQKNKKEERIFNQDSVNVGDELVFIVNATEPFNNLIYEVMAKGDIVLARNVLSSHSKSSFEISIPITHRMTPKARLIVYYIRDENQEIVADVLNFNVNGAFKTPVKLFSNVNETKPGAVVEINVNTRPSAYVGLLGVDQSVLLLKSGFDITQQDVLNELESYDSGKKSHDSLRFFGHWWWSGATTAGEVFDDSGVVMLTNGLLHRHIYARFGKRIFYTSNGGVIVRKKYRPEAPKQLANIRLDDMILEEALQPPDFKIPPRTESRIVLRKSFPDTWIWTNITTGNDGFARYSDSIPDTITSWYISAFAVDSITGLGVAPDALKINVFRPFFIKLSLPYSIIRGESVSIQAIIFNYQNQPINADVVMDNPDDEFEFTNAANEIEFADESSVKEKRKSITIGPFDGVSVSFLITPKKLGFITLRVRAHADNSGDAIIKKLLVKPEGQTQYFNKAMLINSIDQASSRTIIKRNVSIDIPPNAVPGSVRVMVSGISDILGPTVNHLDDLLRMPYGCGEQNMINLVPNIVVSNYLQRVNRMTEAIRTKVKRHIETGYQRELTYRREDGSFSAFGNSDKAGSTWLTAFVVKTFIQARQHIDVDSVVITKSIGWLLNRQKKDGSFAEYGEVHNKALQGGSAIKLNQGDSKLETDNAGALTAFVLIAIFQELKSDAMFSKNDFALQRSTDFIYSRVASSTSPYEVAISAYALHVADSPHKDFAYKKLMAMVKRDQEGLIYWTTRPDEQQNKTSERLKVYASDYLLYPNAIDIETTSYGILTMAMRSEIETALPALRWLISKQNSNGGFSSTQDTVIGLQALGAIAERISTATVKLAVNIKHGNAREGDRSGPVRQSLYFQTDNALVLQQIQLDPETEWVDLEAIGFGTAIIQVSYQYNLAVSAEKPAFFLNPQKDKTSTENYLQLSICTYYKEDENSTNMAVMEVELPSGYNADVEALSAATRAKEVKRVDTTNNDGTVIVYLDRVTKDELCITVPAHRTHHVANNKPVPVTIYDYYDRSKLSRIFYEPTLVTFCDICPQNEVDCKARCAQSQRQRLAEESSRSSLDNSGDKEYNPNSSFGLHFKFFINLMLLFISTLIIN